MIQYFEDHPPVRYVCWDIVSRSSHIWTCFWVDPSRAWDRAEHESERDDNQCLLRIRGSSCHIGAAHPLPVAATPYCSLSISNSRSVLIDAWQTLLWETLELIDGSLTQTILWVSKSLEGSGIEDTACFGKAGSKGPSSKAEGLAGHICGYLLAWRIAMRLT